MNAKILQKRLLFLVKKEVKKRIKKDKIGSKSIATLIECSPETLSRIMNDRSNPSINFLVNASYKLNLCRVKSILSKI